MLVLKIYSQKFDRDNNTQKSEIHMKHKYMNIVYILHDCLRKSKKNIFPYIFEKMFKRYTWLCLA